MPAIKTVREDNYYFVAISGSLRKKLKVQPPFQAIEKWFEIKPELFSQNLMNIKIKFLSLEY